MKINPQKNNMTAKLTLLMFEAHFLIIYSFFLYGLFFQIRLEKAALTAEMCRFFSIFLTTLFSIRKNCYYELLSHKNNRFYEKAILAYLKNHYFFV